MQTTLAVTALLMGLSGGPHCLVMCGAACAGISRAQPGAKARSSLWLFQLGRALGYAALGGLAAWSMQGLGWLSVHSAALRPVWTLFHVAVAVLGGLLCWQGRQPAWLEQAATQVWQSIGRFSRRIRGGALVMGLLWAFLPCGLLYSALLVAALTSHPLQGALVMLLFAAGGSIFLVSGPWLWARLQRRGNASAVWAIRLAGLALCASSITALWMGLVHNTAPWCVTNPVI